LTEVVTLTDFKLIDFIGVLGAAQLPGFVAPGHVCMIDMRHCSKPETIVLTHASDNNTRKFVASVILDLG